LNLTGKKKYSLLCFTAAIPILLFFANTPIANNGGESENNSTVTIVGAEHFQINKVVSADFRFSPNSPIHVRHGDTLAIKETSNDGHTLTFVDASALPSTFNGIFFCGAPNIISPGFVGSPACVQAPGYPFFLHLTQNFPPPWLPIPASCLPGPICNQYVDGGAASNTNTLGVDTTWSFNPDGSIKTSGDSIFILPGQTITVTVTASPGAHLHFMCIFHPWMQGEIIVDDSGGD